MFPEPRDVEWMQDPTSIIDELISPPRLRLPDEESERRSTWLELFYDLVFAAVVSALGLRLGRDISLAGVLGFVALFVPVWWAWLGYTVYNTRFDTDDLIQRLGTFAMMLAAAAMALQIPKALEARSAQFAAAYVAARAILLLLYGRAWKSAPEARHVTTLLLGSFSIGVLLWLISIFVPPPARFVLWGVGLLVDLVAPWVGRTRLQRAPLDTAHLPERLGLFTLIVLGETLLGVVTGISAVNLRLPSLLAGVLGFMIVASFWWVYFAFLDAAPFVYRLGSGQPYIYAHLPVYIALTVFGIGIKRSIMLAGAPVLPLEARWLLGAALALWLATSLLLRMVSLSYIPPLEVHGRYLITALWVVGVLVLVGGRLAPLPTLALVVIGLVLFAIYEVRHWQRYTKANTPVGDSRDDVIARPQGPSAP